ncbi:MAG: M48 family metalloprotease [Thermomicrobiaceae bacterium]|nr:M48 family metalloprotease [Thermomicrobiaceae bacterium]
MRSLALVLVLVLVVPVVAYLVAVGVEGRYESTWQSLLARQFPQVPKARRQALTFARACADPALSSDALCGDLRRVHLLRSGSLATGLLAVALCSGIALAGHASRSDRDLLLKTFRPGLYVTILGLIVIIALEAALAIGALYYGESTYLGIIQPKLILVLGLGAALGVLTLIRAAVASLKPASVRVLGRLVSREREPELWRAVDDLARRVGTEPPRSIVVGLEDNFFVTEADVVCLDGPAAGRTLYLSLPLCRVLDVDEFRAIVAHELGHFRGRDTEFSRKFYPIYAGATASLEGLATQMRRGLRGLILWPAALILAFFLTSFEEAESAISRDRELEADRVAAGIAGAGAFATGLLKVHALADLWPSLLASVRAALDAGKQFTNLSLVYERRAAERILAGKLSAMAVVGESVPHPTDTHPPLLTRLEAAGRSLADAMNAMALPEHPASSLLGGQEALEEDLTVAWHAVVAKATRAEEVAATEASPGRA